MKNPDERSVWVPDPVKRGCTPLKISKLHNKILSHYVCNVTLFCDKKENLRFFVRKVVFFSSYYTYTFCS